MVTDELAYGARFAHDLGIASWLGGSIYDLVANQRAVREIPDQHDRSVVVAKGWKALDVVTAVGVGAAAAGWGAARLTEARPDRLAGPEKSLSLLKDALTAAAVGVAAFHGSQRRRFIREAGARRPAVENGLKPAPMTPRDVAELQNSIRKVGNVKLTIGASLLAVNSVLAQFAHSRPATRRAVLRTAHPDEGRTSPLTKFAVAAGAAAAIDELRRRTGEHDRDHALRGMVGSQNGAGRRRVGAHA